MPLAATPREILDDIQKLAPRRDYYPKEKKTLQSVTWNPDLTMTIQHDAFEIVVRSILHKSEQLQEFQTNSGNDEIQSDAYFPSHLRERGIVQRCLYERSMLTDANKKPHADVSYTFGGQKTDAKRASKVYHLVKMMTKRSFAMPPTRDLASILQEWPLLGGFQSTAEILPASLTDAVERQLSEQFGSLVNAFAGSRPQDVYHLMFRLGLMSLNPKSDVDLLKILAAFASLTELRSIQAPPHRSFNEFKLNDIPTAESLLQVISVDLPEQGQRRYDRAQEAHRRACMEEGRRLTKFVAAQWPNAGITLDGFEFDVDLIDAGLAMERLVVEWKRLLENSELSSYVVQVQDTLARQQGARDTSNPTVWSLSQPPFHIRDRTSGAISAAELLSKHLTTALTVSNRHDLIPDFSPGSRPNIQSSEKSKTFSDLRKILCAFTSSSDLLRQQYGKDLEGSLRALDAGSPQARPASTRKALNVMTIPSGIQELRTMIADHLVSLRNALSADDDCFKWLELANLWPCKTSCELLEQLRSSNHGLELDEIAKQAIISHGILITTLQ
jgi:hypothetical protein